MKRHTFFRFVVVLVLASMVLAACTPAATSTPAATPTAAAAYQEIAFEPMKVEAPNCEYGDTPIIKSIESVDATTVKFTLCTPDPAFASKVAFSAFAIQDQGFMNATSGDSVKLSENPVASGPYMLKEWVRGDHITLVPNPNYWGDQPAAKTVTIRWSEQAAQRLLELQSGTVDGIDNPAPEDFATIEGDDNLALYPRQALNVFYVGFQVDLEPFDDERVRQAFALGIDKQRIVDNFYPAGSSVAEQFLPDALKPGHTDGMEGTAYNPEEAKRLLAEAGYEDGLEVTLTYRNVVRGYLPTPDKVAQDIQAQLADIGVTVTLEEMESAAFIDATSLGEKAFYLLGWGADYPDATNFFDYHFANTQNLQFGTLFEDIVTEIRAGGSLTDPAQRQAHYDKVNELLQQHVPMIPVAHGGSATAYKASVQGAHSSPLSNEVFGVLNTGTDQFVWMQNGEPASLWCADETDGETLRACEQIYGSLLSYSVGGVEVEPGLAVSWTSNDDLTEWTFKLREGMKFSNGYAIDASDVVASFVAQWDAASPNHKGRVGNFEYFGAMFGSMLNAPPATE